MIRRANFREEQMIKSLAPKIAYEMSNGYLNEAPKSVNDPNFTPHHYFLVDIEKGKIRGWVSVGDMIDPFTHTQSGFINELYVFHQYRKSGIGRTLMEHALYDLKVQGYHKVQLNVFAGNSAQALYKELGFQDVSTIMEKYL